MSKHLSAALLAATVGLSTATAADRPNVLMVITDDQGYGDLGCHGNPVLKTPHVDAFARRSVQLANFYVCPVCSPTRSSLLTGRYNYRTGVVDTFIGRSMMHPDEVTLAEVMRNTGYRTGLFGKWHLGDCYPMRPQDQGFQEVLMHRGGGIAQPSDPPGGSLYQDPALFRNGKETKCRGYVTDVLTDATIDFIGAKSDQPFFAYVAYNCPHAPYQVKEADWRPYRGMDLGPDAFPKLGSQWATPKLNQEEIGKAYGMIANIDANFGRLLAKVSDNTLIIFMTDNGPGGVRWNAGLRNRKGTVYEGGIRVPCYVCWKEFVGGRKVDVPTAHIDVFPTILEACGMTTPKDVALDGRSLLPLLRGDDVGWPERNLFFQWHRGHIPEMGRAFAARGQRYKLVQAAGVQPGIYKPKYELFDITKDPFEERDLSADQPDVVKELRARYEEWFKDVKSPRNFEGPRIHLGSDKQNPLVLTRQDWRGPQAGWADTSVGYWDVTVERAGMFRVRIDFASAKEPRVLTARLGAIKATVEVPGGRARVVVEAMRLPLGDARLEAWLDGNARTGVTHVEVERVGD